MSSYKKPKESPSGPFSNSDSKSPFIYMPVTSSGSENVHKDKKKGTTNDKDPHHRPHPKPTISDSNTIQKPAQSETELALKVARRNAAIQKELRSRLINHGASESNLAVAATRAQENLRRPPRALYPNPKEPTSQSSISTQDLYSSRSQNRLQVAGVQAPAPHLVNRGTYAATRFRTKEPPLEESGPPTPEIPGWPKKSLDIKRPCNPISTPAAAAPVVIPAQQSTIDEEQISQLQHQIDRLSLHVMTKDKEIGTLRKDLVHLKEKLKKSKIESEDLTTTVSRIQLKLSKFDTQLELLEERMDEQDDSFMINYNQLRAVEIEAQANSQQLSPISPAGSSNLLKSFNSLAGKYSGIYKTDLKVDYDTIACRLRDLNMISGHQSVELVTTKGVGGSFRLPKALGITLYKNGFVVEDDAELFRPYNSSTGILFMQDVYDGYFPTELQKDYPEGVSITVKDRRSEVYPFNGGFTNKGNTLGREENWPDLWPGVIPVPRERKIIRKISSPCPPSPSPSILEIKQLPACATASPKARLSNANEIITLKLKNMSTEKCYKISASIYTTPQELCFHLKEVLAPESVSFPIDEDTEEFASDLGGSGDGPQTPKLKSTSTPTNFELINSYPFGKFQVGSATLRDYGIRTNSMIYFRPISQ